VRDAAGLLTGGEGANFDDRAPTAPPTEIFKALGDPIRWSIVTQMASVAELACLTLEGSLPVSKPTISYHTKILHQAGLISVRKEGRNYFYSLRREVLHEVLDSLSELTPAPWPAGDQEIGHARPGGRRPSAGGGRRRGDRGRFATSAGQRTRRSSSPGSTARVGSVALEARRAVFPASLDTFVDVRR
jgi:DNA-binding transcriptional ArsR family regulator